MRLHLRQLRSRLGWSQEELAHRANLHRSTVSQLENDRHGWTSATLHMFAALFDVPEHEVLGYAHPPDADLPEATRDLVRRVLALDEQGLDMVRTQVAQAEKMGFTRGGDEP